MAKELKILNLSLNPSDHVSTDQLLACDDLESDLLIGRPMNSELDLAEGTLAQRLDNIVGADALVDLGLLARLLRSAIGSLAGGSRAAIGGIGGGVDNVDGGDSGALVVPSDLRRGEGHGELLLVVASRSHVGEAQSAG